MDSSFWTAFALGVAFCAPPGPIIAEALRRGMHRGFGGALLVELGSLVGDATWAAIALSGAAYLVAYRLPATALAALGVLLLFYLAWRALRDAWAGAIPAAGRPASGGDFVSGAALSLSNPQNIAFWLGIGGGAIAALEPGRHHGPAVFFAAFMLACLAWCFFVAAMIAWGRRWLSAGFFRGLNLLCGAALAYFGVRLLAGLAAPGGR